MGDELRVTGFPAARAVFALELTSPLIVTLNRHPYSSPSFVTDIGDLRRSGPTLAFGLEEGAELLRSAGDDIRPVQREALHDLGPLRCLDDVLVETLHHRLRGTARRQH